METTAVTTVMAMTDVMTNTGSIFSTAVGMIGNVVTTITGNPILLVFVLIPLVGLGVGFFHRLKH